MVHAKKDKNWQRIGCLIALSGFLVLNSVEAQVTIGSGNPPAKGALLDLKVNDNPGGVTAEKGIIFPRVRLASLKSLLPLLKAVDAADSTEKQIHKGTIVYNVGMYLPEGLYCWDGEKWIKLLGNINDAWLTTGNAKTNAGINFIGTTDEQPLVFKVKKEIAGYIGADKNTALGFLAGGNGLTGGNNNIAIGANTDLSPYGESNQMNIGNAIFGTGMNGSRTAPAGNIGIGTSTPTSTLEVNGSIAGSYREITKPSYKLLPTDYVVCYNGATNATFSMPDITTPIAGRVYYIKNLTADSVLTLSAGSATFRRGGTSPEQSTMTVPSGYHTMIVANTNTSGQVWDVLSLQNSQIATTGWVLVATDIMSIIDTPQELDFSTKENPYHDIEGTDLTVTVPADLSGQNQILLRWDVWGDVNADNASGSIRFAVKEQPHGKAIVPHESIMMTSWATPNKNYNRWSAPVVFGLKNVDPGTYTFTLQARRALEVLGSASATGSILAVPTLYGVQGKAEVFIK
jgi:hypothetical protein